MILTNVVTDNAPAAIGPYSQAVIAGDTVYCSGQIALSPDGSDLVGDDAPEQARQVLHNLDAVLRAAGSDPTLVIKTTVYLTNMDDFPEVNRVYEEFFGDTRPARATVEVSRLPKNALIEMDCVAARAEH